MITNFTDQNPLGYPGSVVETASGEIRAAALCSDGAAARVPVPETLPELHFPPELDFDKTQKLDWVGTLFPGSLWILEDFQLSW